MLPFKEAGRKIDDCNSGFQTNLAPFAPARITIRMSVPHSADSHLFSRGNIVHAIVRRRQNLIAAVTVIDPKRLLEISTEELCTSLVRRFRLDTPSLDTTNVSLQGLVTETAARTPFSARRRPDTSVQLFVPFHGDAALFGLHPGWYLWHLPRAKVSNGTLQIQVDGAELEKAHPRSVLDDRVMEVQRYLDSQRERTDRFNVTLPKFARAQIEEQKNIIRAQQKLLAEAGYPVQPHTTDHAAPAVPKPIKVTPQRPETEADGWVLEDREYIEILDTIVHMSLSIESDPTSFATMGEEALRQVFLAALNGMVKGQATAETFNYSGKTDILIIREGRRVFIAECKLWRGKESLLGAIDQILSYLSYRDTKAAVSLFSRNEDFSSVLKTIQATVPTHPSYRSGPDVKEETQFHYVFGHNRDLSRKVFLAVLAFDVYPPRANNKRESN